MRMCSIASGSSGNCVYVGSDATHLLVDVGISGKKTESGLEELGISGGDLDGILITHEHADHISGLGVLARKYEIPIYATRGTIEAVRQMKSMGSIDQELWVEVKEDQRFTIKDLTVNPLRISHDAAQPVAYRISYGSKRVAVCTDLGVYNDYTVECLKGLDAILLEANHDVESLSSGPYPYYLKKRILGRLGHLSNEDAAKFAVTLAENGANEIILAHLSLENNTPAMARNAVEQALSAAHLAPVLSVAPRDALGEAHVLGEREPVCSGLF